MKPIKLNMEKELANAASDISKMAVTPVNRRDTGVTAIAGKNLPACAPPEPEVLEKKARRKFSAKYKLKILEATDNCTEPGHIGKVLRREGLYSSNLTLWRNQRSKGILQGIAPKKRGRKKEQRNPLADEVAKLQREIRQLKLKLANAQLIIEAQKKISALMEMSVQASENMSL